MEINNILDNIKLYYLKNISENIENKVLIQHINNLKNTISETNTPTDSETIYTDDYIYKKEWNKLNNIHKQIKIKQFVNNKLNINNKKEEDDLKRTLTNLVKTKQLTQKKTVNYDSFNGKIISINCLKFNNGNYEIEL